MNPNIRLAIIVAVFVVLAFLIYSVLGRTGVEAPAEDGDVAMAGPAADSTNEPGPAPAFEPSTPAAGVGSSSEPEVANTGIRSGTTKRAAVGGFERSGEGVIYGVVLDDRGSPVSGAHVTLEQYDFWANMEKPSEARMMETESGGAGRFQFDSLPAGSFMLSARKGHSVGSLGVWVGTNRTHQDVVIQVEPGGTLGGIVRSASGEPVAGAVVHPHELEGEAENQNRRWADRRALRVETDNDGRFNFDALPDGRWKFVVWAENYATFESGFVALGRDDVEFVLEGGGSLAGTVADVSTQEPVAEITVRVAHTRLDINRHEIATDSDGNFHFPALMAGDYLVTVDDPELVIAGEVVEAAIAENQETIVNLEVAMGGVVTGRVYDKDSGRGIAGAVVTANADGNTGQPPRRSEPTDSEGRYRLEGLAAGRQRIMPEEVPNYPNPDWQQSQYITAAVGSTVDGVDFPMGQGIVISGRVVNKGGGPVTGAVVTGRTENWYPQDTTRSGSGGRFEVKGFNLASKVYLWASHEDRISAMLGPLNLASDDLENIELELSMSRDGSIEGVVVDAQGRPVPDLRLYARSSEHQYMDGAQTQADEDGNFSLYRLPPGTYQFQMMVADSNMFQQTDNSVTLEEGESLTGVELEYTQNDGLTISGRVTGEDGEPLRNANVNVYGSGGNGYANTDETGDYEVANLGEGTYTVQADHFEYSRDSYREIPAGSANIDFRLKENGAVEGQVLDARTSQPIQDFEIQALEGQETEIRPWMSQQFTRVHDPEGRFRVTRVDASGSTLAARAKGYAPAFQPVGQFAPGETVEGVTVMLERSAIVEGVVVGDGGKPVAGALIFVGELPGQWERARAAAAESAADGSFVLDSLPADATVVSAYHPTYAAGHASLAGAGPVEIVMSQGGTIQGRVTLGNEPMANQHVYIQFDDSPQSTEGTQTDASGGFEFTNVTPGNVTVNANQQMSDNQWRNVQRPAAVASGQVTTVDLVFDPLNASLEGRVTVAGQAATGGSVSVSVTTSGGEESFNAQVGGDGTYRFDALPAGAARLEVYGSNETSSGRTQLSVNLIANRRVQQDVVLGRSARISGMLTGGQRQMRGVSVFFGEIVLPDTFTPSTLAALDSQRAAQDTVDADGAYLFDSLEAGTYTLVAWSVDGTDAASLANIQLSRAVVVNLEAEEEVSMDFQLP